jgi:mannose-6-phosphate isomerase-like protein (cupin superfamily)
MTQLKGLVKKGWGSEFIWVTNDKYCGKFLNFETGGKFSMHFHREKVETWYVQSGKFEVEVIDTHNASIHKKLIGEGMIHHNDPLVPHRVTCLEAGTILEISTPDSVEDNYRVMPGDSQNAKV